MADLVDKLSKDPLLAREYQFNRMGVDTTDSTQMADGLKAY